MAIKIGTLNIGNVKNGNNQIAKVYCGTNLIWENYRVYYGNPYTNSNIRIGNRWTSDATYYSPLSEAQWKKVMTGQYESYVNAFHHQYAIIELLNYATIRPLNFRNDIHDYYPSGEYPNNYTCLDIYGSGIRGYQVSQDGVTWYDCTFGIDIDYQRFGIEYVRYIRLSMAMQNRTFMSDTPYTCNMTCTKYIGK